MMEWHTCRGTRRDMPANLPPYSIAESGTTPALEAECAFEGAPVEVGEWVTRPYTMAACENAATLGRTARRLMATERARLLHPAGNLGRLTLKRKVHLRQQLWRGARKPLI